MSENVLQTIQTLLQDVIAPDVRETKVRLESLTHETKTRFDAVAVDLAMLQKQMDTRFDAIAGDFAMLQKQVDTRFDAFQKQLDIQMEGMEKQMSFLEKSLLSAFAESRARIELTGATAIVDLRERIAVLESKHN